MSKDCHTETHDDLSLPEFVRQTTDTNPHGPGKDTSATNEFLFTTTKTLNEIKTMSVGVDAPLLKPPGLIPRQRTFQDPHTGKPIFTEDFS